MFIANWIKNMFLINVMTIVFPYIIFNTWSSNKISLQLSVAKPNLNLLLTTNKTKYSASLIWTIAKTKPKQSNWKPDFLQHLIKNCCNTAIDITIDWTGIENYNSTGCMVSWSTYHRHCWCTRHGKVQGLLKWTHQCSV